MAINDPFIDLKYMVSDHLTTTINCNTDTTQKGSNTRLKRQGIIQTVFTCKGPLHGKAISLTGIQSKREKAKERSRNTAEISKFRANKSKWSKRKE